MILDTISKQPAEEYALTVDFAAELEAGETILSATVTSRNAGTNADSSAIFLTAAAVAIASSLVSKRVQAGSDGQTHIVQFRATTSLGNVYEHEVAVIVAES